MVQLTQNKIKILCIIVLKFNICTSLKFVAKKEHLVKKMTSTYTELFHPRPLFLFELRGVGGGGLGSNNLGKVISAKTFN